jgi:hypothetical protein
MSNTQAWADTEARLRELIVENLQDECHVRLDCATLANRRKHYELAHAETHLAIAYSAAAGVLSDADDEPSDTVSTWHGASKLHQEIVIRTLLGCEQGHLLGSSDCRAKALLVLADSEASAAEAARTARAILVECLAFPELFSIEEDE